MAKNKEENNINNEIDNDINEKNENGGKDNEENKGNEEVDNYENNLKIQEILQKYFFNDKNELKYNSPSKNELDEIKDYYKILTEKNLDFANFQENYIFEVNKEISKIKDKSKLKQVALRKEKIQILLKNYFDELDREERRKKNIHNWRKNYNYKYGK